MKIIKLTIFILFIGILSANAQNDKYAHDVVSIESLNKAYYDCISGPIGQKRDFDRLRNLFHPKASFVYSYWSEEENKAKLMIFDFDGYLEKLDYLDKKGFYEKEIANTEKSYGTITQSISTYKFWMEDKTAEGRGVTSYNYFYDGERYWIMSMFWQMESDKFPIPEEFLTKGQH